MDNQRINMERIFGNGDINYEETLRGILELVKSQEWTTKMDALLNAILQDGMSVEGWAEMLDISLKTAKQDYDMAYRALKLMATEGQICPVKA